jgi:mono/diheme cytochrome c family protein
MRFGVCASALLALAACGGGVADRQPIAGADPGRGRELIASVGCASCHVIPGVEWPRGRVGPSLEGFASRSLIAGRHANQPDILADFVRNAPAYAPDAGMPPMPLTEQEARDVAAYLYTLRAR